MADTMLPGDIRVEGVRLNSFAFNVNLVNGTSQIPERDLVGIPGPQTDGTTPVAGRYATPPQFRLSMWVSGWQSDGTEASDPRAQFETNLNSLISAFISQSATVTVERQMPDGTIRTCEARVAGSVIPTLPGAGETLVASLEVVLDIPAIFWRDQAGPFTETISWANASAGYQPNFLGGKATAPITDGIYTVAGPIVNPKISNPYGGYIQYNGTLNSGDTWVVDSSAWTSKVNGSSVMFDCDYYKNSSYLFELWPAYQVTLSGTGTTAGVTELTITADRKYF